MSNLPPRGPRGNGVDHADDLETGYKRFEDHSLTVDRATGGERFPSFNSQSNTSSRSVPASPRTRRSTLAREAYCKRDITASVKAHLKPIEHDEHDNEGGEYIKPIVFGGLDGISTMFAFLMGACGADLTIESVVALGIAQLVAGAMGMGMGEYLSAQADADVARMEMDRERWEVENNPDGEIHEMVQIYKNKGLSSEDAMTVAKTLSKYEEFWIEHMMLTEIGIIPELTTPMESFKAGIVMFLAFFFLGGAPLLVYAVGVLSFEMHDLHSRLLLCCVGSGLPLLILGAMRAKVADKPVVSGALMMLAQGGICAVGAFVLATYAPLWIGFGTNDKASSVEF